MEYKVSIIMGIYNCSETLDEAIQSLLNQTFQEWKLIMCDDCSTDHTYEKAQTYADQYDNILLIHNDKNRGLNYTLNHCLKYVDTKYVARMDGDDISLPTRLEKEIDFLERYQQYAIVSCSMIHFDESGDWGIERLPQEPSQEFYIKRTPFCHAPSMAKAEAYKKVGGYSVDSRLLRVEDYHLWYKMCINGFIGYNLEEPLYKMRDDRSAFNRRKYKYRVNEAYVKYLIFKNFHLSMKYIIYILKPLIVGLIPRFIYDLLHKNTLK